MISTIKNKRTTLIILFCIVLFAIGLGIRSELWRSSNHLDEVPELWDEAHFTIMSVRLHQMMSDDLGEAYKHFVEFSPNQAPLVPLMASFFYYVFPVSVESALYLNTFCIAVIGMTVFLLAARYSRLAGILAAATVMCLIPNLTFMSRLRTELPLAMMVSLVILFLIKSAYFKKTGWAIAAGIVAGLAMLTNPIGLVYLVWPVLYCLIRGMIESRAQITRVFNFLGGFACAFAVMVVWYMPNYLEIKRFLFDYGYGSVAKEHGQTHPGITKYPGLIWNAWNGLLPAIIAAAVIVLILALVFRKKGLRVVGGKIDLWLFAVWVVLSYAFLNTTGDQRIRFLLPLLPGGCVLLGYLAASVRSGLGRKISAATIGLACMMGLFYASTISFAHVELVDISENRDWKIEEIAQTIEKYHNMQGPKRKIRVAFLAHHPFFNAKGFDLAALLSGHDFQIKYPEQNEYANAIASISDYVIYKTGYQFPDPIHPTTKRYFSIPEAGKKFERICEFDLPDGKAILYRRIP